MGVLIGLIVFAFFTFLYNHQVLKKFELITLSWRFNYFHSQTSSSDDIIVLGITSDSMRYFGDWKWSRGVFAETLEALDFFGAKSVSFDLFFPGEHRCAKKGDKLFAEEFKKFQDNGKYLTLATVVDSVYHSIKNYYSEPVKKKFKLLSLNNKNKIKALTVREIIPQHSDDYINDYNIYLQKPYQALFDNVRSIGIVNIINTESAIFDTPLFVEFDSMYFATLGLATYFNINHKSNVLQGNGFVFADDLKVPVFGDNRFMLNWYKPNSGGVPYSTIPINKLVRSYKFLERGSKELGITKEELQSKIDQIYECMPDNCSKELIELEKRYPEEPTVNSKTYKGKYVFIGVLDQSTGIKDLIKTPFSDGTPGVYLHANLFDNLMQKDFIVRLSYQTTLLVMLVFSVLTGLTLLGIKNPRYSLTAGLIFCLYPVVPMLLFKYKNIYTDMIYTELAIILTYILSVAYQWVVVEKDKRDISKTFSNYLAPQVLNEILSDPSKLKLGGKKREISILFSDIRGFTTISEQNTPEGVVEFLNEFFDAMVEQIIKAEGTVDKFIGDAIMAFWGAPVEKENHAELAVRGALGMVQGLKELKQKWVLEGRDIPEINIGIGINTGEAIVGNVGASKIKSYTVIGDSVNLASRLEGLNKEYLGIGDPDISIIISEFTYEHVKDIVEVEYANEVKVKGKDIAVKIYKVIGIRGDSNE